MKTSSKYTINVLAVGFCVLVLTSIVLFWIRWIPEALFQESRVSSISAELKPTGIMPGEAEDPNVKVPSLAIAHLGDWAMYSLGVFRDIEMQPETHEQFGVAGIFINYIIEKERQQNKGISKRLYFDKKSGLYIYCGIFREEQEDKTSWAKEIYYYIGPEGISENPGEGLGRFIEPIQTKRSGDVIIFDKALSRFFRVNSEEQKVISGAELPEDYRPIQIGRLFKNREILGGLNFSLPLRQATPQELKDKRKTQRETVIREDWDDSRERIVYVAMDGYDYSPFSEKYILVLDESGRIDKLDTETLEFAGSVGRLPAAPSFFASGLPVTAKNLLGYRVLSWASKDGRHKALLAASASRGADGLTLALFNEDGTLTRQNFSKPADNKKARFNRSARETLMTTPWGPALMVAKYLTENLQPPILSIASYFSASRFEAADGYQAMLILPNSFVAMLAREFSDNEIARFFTVAFMILPSVMLAILLAWRLRKDAVIVGISKRSALYWTIATFAFGPVAYITYRLTRPKQTMVTCLNCGKLRRPDNDECHRCAGKWDVPELTPPLWRVIDTKSQS